MENEKVSVRKVCDNCFYFDTSTTVYGEEESGACRRRCPQVVVNHSLGAWPMVMSGEWWGEWEKGHGVEDEL